jgi:endonuclease YncB( thermonuclease family)
MGAYALRYTTWRITLAVIAGVSFTASLQHASAPAARSWLAPDQAVRVVDGDTLIVGPTRVRLGGIDAPEAGQTCSDKRGKSWPCGVAATAELISLVRGRAVRCVPDGRDRYGRTLAECFAGGENLNAHMVRRGYAWAFVRYSRRYVAEEAAARHEGIGIWQGEAMPAWEYRARLRAHAVADPEQGCAIKDIVAGYFDRAPDSPWFAQMHRELRRGQRWLCSKAAAFASAWHVAHAR